MYLSTDETTDSCEKLRRHKPRQLFQTPAHPVCNLGARKWRMPLPAGHSASCLRFCSFSNIHFDGPLKLWIPSSLSTWVSSRRVQYFLILVMWMAFSQWRTNLLCSLVRFPNFLRLKRKMKKKKREKNPAKPPPFHLRLSNTGDLGTGYLSTYQYHITSWVMVWSKSRQRSTLYRSWADCGSTRWWMGVW